MTNAYFSFACNPLRETPVERHEGNFSYRFTYARAAETKRAGDRGQDYLTCIELEQAFVFALCDGVSLSFCGDIAAQFLADHLRDWLLAESQQRIVSSEMLQSELTHYLQELTTEATHVVKTTPLPSEVTGILRDVLEEKRVLGSETTFVCGRIDLPSEQWPDGRILLAWMGDSRLRLWGQRTEWSAQLPGSFQTAERWSTRRGLVGQSLHVFVSSLRKHGFDHLTAYSDGLADLDVWEDIPDDRTLQALVESTFRKPTSDDVSLIDVRWTLQPPQFYQVARQEASAEEEEVEEFSYEEVPLEGLWTRIRKMFERR